MSGVFIRKNLPGKNKDQRGKKNQVYISILNEYLDT